TGTDVPAVSGTRIQLLPPGKCGLRLILVLKSDFSGRPGSAPRRLHPLHVGVAEPASIGDKGLRRQEGAMSERTSYAAGTPCWVELGTPDLAGAIEFYSGLFGWEVPTPPPEVDEQTGGYRRAQKNGRDVAGMASLMAEGQPPAWSTYVSVED